MADRLRISTGWLIIALAWAPAAAWAESMPDPTRPPAEVLAPVSTEGAPQAAANPLQCIIIAPNRRAAIINGQTVEQGERVGDAKLLEVREGQVVLQGPQGKEVLSLFPRVEIRRIGAGQEGTPGVQKKTAKTKRAERKGDK